MFERKYVFETRSTRTKRLAFNFTLLSAVLITVFVLFTAFLPIYANSKREIADLALFKKEPDVIVVLTGDSGRIAYALELSKKYKSAKIFITGVYAKNSLKTLVHSQGDDLSVDEFIHQQSHHIDLDYNARNTVENGIATLHYLRQQPESRRILIVTSDYHILRTKLIVDTLFDQELKYNFYYSGIKNDYDSWRRIKILMKEVYKIAKTASFLFFWDQENFI